MDPVKMRKAYLALTDIFRLHRGGYRGFGLTPRMNAFGYPKMGLVLDSEAHRDGIVSWD